MIHRRSLGVVALPRRAWGLAAFCFSSWELYRCDSCVFNWRKPCLDIEFSIDRSVDSEAFPVATFSIGESKDEIERRSSNAFYKTRRSSIRCIPLLFFHLLVVSIYLDFSAPNQFFNMEETTPEEIFSESLEHSFSKRQR